ncbi:hypothetical protein Pla22_38080 [Rubripirellula amarantea]|uniref:mRNA interferase HigB n=1 Tax=Rubripirellula amarantea TaxID=2527999 RepID=A0A5C5WMK5_9BACT|nr:hypothetical protein [Rubripirellula amarantea]TWT51032.1 hypothetical protein Pla22_38080 [Rubripirellula amarantea]
MNHRTTSGFWQLYGELPEAIRNLADKNFDLLKQDLAHPSLHFKKVGRFRSARVGLNYRVLAVEIDEGLLWFWIGDHASYERMIGS